jgi:serine/threonine protein phosphatase PrpC
MNNDFTQRACNPANLDQVTTADQERQKDMTYKIGYTQHHGKNRQFPMQQDALFTGQMVLQSQFVEASEYSHEQDNITLAVADGVGNSPQAEKASLCVLQVLEREIKNGTAFNAHLMGRLHGGLCDQLAEGPTFGSSTTIAAIQCRQNQCTVMNVGDSRIYRIDANGDWSQLSSDHTLINSLINEGKANPDLEYASFYYALDSCLVADDEEYDFQIHHGRCTLMSGDSLLLCTDGVHDVLDARQLKKLFQKSLSITDQLNLVSKAILKAGAPDNFSMILARAI